MKKLLLFFSLILFFSCNGDDDMYTDAGSERNLKSSNATELVEVFMYMQDARGIPVLSMNVSTNYVSNRKLPHTLSASEIFIRGNSSSKLYLFSPNPEEYLNNSYWSSKAYAYPSYIWQAGTFGVCQDFFLDSRHLENSTTFILEDIFIFFYDSTGKLVKEFYFLPEDSFNGEDCMKSVIIGNVEYRFYFQNKVSLT